MSYRCNVCSTVVPAGQGRLVHTVYRVVPCSLPVRHTPEQEHTMGGRNSLLRNIRTTRQEIAQQIPVCNACYKELQTGTSIAVLRQRRPAKPKPAVLTFKPLPPKPSVSASSLYNTAIS